jgi:hypothetical protein
MQALYAVTTLGAMSRSRGGPLWRLSNSGHIAAKWARRWATHVQARLENQARCLLVIIGARRKGARRPHQWLPIPVHRLSRISMGRRPSTPTGRVLVHDPSQLGGPAVPQDTILRAWRNHRGGTPAGRAGCEICHRGCGLPRRVKFHPRDPRGALFRHVS